MVKQTRTVLEYKAPKCKMTDVVAQGVLCTSTDYTGGYIDDADEEDLETL